MVSTHKEPFQNYAIMRGSEVPIGSDWPEYGKDLANTICDYEQIVQHRRY